MKLSYTSANNTVGFASGVITILTASTTLKICAASLFVVCAVVWIRNWLKSPYEFRIKTRKIVLDILDETGSKVLCETSSTIEILKNNTFNYIESIICDGKTCDVESKIGTIVEIRREKGQQIVKTTLIHERSKGEVIDVGLAYTCLDSYTSEQEYYHYTQLYPGEQVRIIIQYPYSRPLKDYFAEKKIGHYRIQSPYKLHQIRYNNKNAIELFIPKIELNESYCITWRW